ncbi:MAG: LexA family transcriptional regulator [Liquorilactobacillus hordei]|uniref:LexA family protein n=1 Tax=Liquorilactobacillus hordei TaxID=468911 RepID=UPI0039E9B88E
MNISDNIKQYRKARGYTQEDLAKKLGVSPNSVSAWELGRNKPLMDKVTIMAKLFDVKSSDIIGDSIENEENNIVSIYEELEPLRKKRVYSFAENQLSEQNGKTIRSGRSTAAGAPIDGDYEDSQEEIVVRSEVPRGADEVVTIAGDSMEPLLKQGSQAFVHYQPVPDNEGQIVIVSIKGDGVTCKRIYREDGKIRLKSINEKYEDMVFPAEDIRIIGKVIISQKK